MRLYALSGLVVTYLLALSSSSFSAIIFSESFESPDVSDYEQYPLGADNTIGDNDNWIVLTPVDLIGTFWNASDGQQCVDMNADLPGAITRSFSSVLGMEYIVTFDMAASYGDAPNETRDMTVAVSNSFSDVEDAIYSQTKSFSLPIVDTAGHPTITWVTGNTWTFTGTGNDMWITFESTSSIKSGPLLDNVVLEEVPEPSTMAIFGIGILGVLLGRR
jgi:hypothetical protein